MMNLCIISAGCIDLLMAALVFHTWRPTMRASSWPGDRVARGKQPAFTSAEIISYSITACHLQKLNKSLHDEHDQDVYEANLRQIQSVCLIFASMPTADPSQLGCHHFLPCSNRQLRTSVLSLNARLIPPTAPYKLPCSPNTSPAVVHHGSDSSKTISACRSRPLGRPSAPILFPGPLIPNEPPYALCFYDFGCG